MWTRAGQLLVARGFMRSAWVAGWPPEQMETDTGPRDCTVVVVEATADAGSMAGALASEDREQLGKKAEADGSGRCGSGKGSGARAEHGPGRTCLRELRCARVPHTCFPFPMH